MNASTRSDAATLLGHPRGLFLLFATEMWERFSYYGMRALLVLYVVAATNAANLKVEGFPIMRHWYIVHRTDKRLSPVAQAFKNFVLGQAGKKNG